jgi:CRP/FNR family cyclic AMP-dependent transcriptional regulator
LDKAGDARRVVSSKLSVLRKHPFFCDLEPEALDQLCRYAKHTTLKRGASIFCRGAPSRSAFPRPTGAMRS